MLKNSRLVLSISTLFLSLGIAFAADAPSGAATPPTPAAPTPAPAANQPQYPIPYTTLPTTESITATLQRELVFLNQAAPTRVIDKNTHAEITDVTTPNPNAIVDRGENSAFGPLEYTIGVTYAGMLQAADATGDPAFKEFVSRHMQFIADRLPYFQAQADKFGMDGNSYITVLAPDSLDAAGAPCAGFVKARLANASPDMKPIIDRWANFIETKQFRIADGTFCRHRPQAESLWSDDSYMSVSALAQLAKLTGDNVYYDDATKQILQFAQHLFNQDKGLYFHGLNLNQPLAPQFYWARANGWAMMASEELLDVLPEDHPGRAEILKNLQTQIKAIATLQGGDGLWHQMLDKPDSYTETSASAMFVYSIAHAINKGWISPVTFGTIAQTGWDAISTRIDDQGHVNGTCISTPFSNDNVFYYHRPTSYQAPHGYGPTLLAGAEMIRLLKNPHIDIQFKDNEYHYVPK
jgi:rhamnogalacturonyl hydrolase YesR